MKHRWWALGGVLLLLVGLSLACASGSPEGRAKGAGAEGAADGSFPPTGPVTLRPQPPPPEGTFYQLLSSYDGRTEISEEGPAAHDDDSQTLEELWAIELDYRQLPIPTPGDDLASSLVLEALKRRLMAQPPGGQHVLEVGDDRLRVSTNDKVGTDLRGAQPKQDLTPRALLGKSFAMLVTDKLGNPKSVMLRGVPSAKKLLSSLGLREPIAYMQIAYPEHPVSAGETWNAKRFFPNPVGRLGLAIDVEYRLVGYEKIGEAPCAHVSLRSALDEKDVKSETGFKFDEVRYTLAGDAWIDLRNGQVARARVEDVSAVAHHRTGGSMIPARVRMRYTTRSAFERLDGMPAAVWADGTKRFSAVK